eukprot:TRINITY_DN20849_c0_g1_i1.p1 TRINITY_DN20849_c0_g1~~TRINITY_DN20849_c0_g1_i1.p1  ORF type:complete len:333 (+),score=49.27 TRINITY_DN20849_c0_g1_i1:29-1000(+)
MSPRRTLVFGDTCDAAPLPRPRGAGALMSVGAKATLLATLVAFVQTSEVRGHGAVAQEQQSLAEWRHIARRLEQETATATDGHASSEAQSDEISVHVPCADFFGYVLVDPCGNLHLTEDGQDIQTPFGAYHIPGTKALLPEVKIFKQAFSRYTLYAGLALLAAYILFNLIIGRRRRRFIKTLKDAASGNISDGLETPEKNDVEDADDEYSDDEPTEEELNAEKADRLDPKSEDFVAPGNIYRLLAVLHPGKVGWVLYMQWASKAAICAWMQVSMPIYIIRHIFQEWHFYYSAVLELDAVCCMECCVFARTPSQKPSTCFNTCA